MISNNSKRLLVTGGAGFIGSNLVAFLLEKGFEVRVIDNFSVGSLNNLPKNKKNLEVIKGDIRSLNVMKKVTKDCDIVFHLAIQCVRKSIHSPLFVHHVNATGTLNVLEASRINDVKKFIYISSSEVYGTAEKVPMNEEHLLAPTTVYGASKLAGEKYTLAYNKTYGFPAMVIRPFNTYGYNEHFEGQYGEVIPRFVLRAINGLPIHIFGSGKQTRDFTFVSDTVRGFWKVAENGKVGNVYNIARGKEVSVIKIAKLIFKTLQVQGSIEYLPDRPGDVYRHYASIKKAQADLGFTPNVDIQEGVREYIEWFKKEIPDPKVALKKYVKNNW
jgi:UDP-glucose 4-epimerase